MEVAMGFRKLIATALLLIVAVFASADPIVLRVAAWDNRRGLDVIRALAKRYESEHPNIRIQLQNFDYVLYQQKMLVQYAANVAPDIAMTDAAYGFRLARRGALLNLNEFVKNDSTLRLKDYYPAILRALSVDGKLFAMPRDVSPMGMIFYRKSAFREAGLPMPDGSWTWDFQPRPELREKDFLWVMQKLTKRQPNGRTDQWGFATNWSSLLPESLLISSGASLVDNDDHPTKFEYTDPRVVKSWQLATDLWHRYRWVANNADITTIEQTSATRLFVNGRVAMYQNGAWEIPLIREMLKPGTSRFFDWDVVPFPRYAHGPRRLLSGGSGYSIFRTTEHPQEAWEFVRYLTGEEGMTAMCAVGAQPAIMRLAKGEPWLPGPNPPPELQYPANIGITDKLVSDMAFLTRSDLARPGIDQIGPLTDLLVLGTERDAGKVLAQAQGIASAQLHKELNEERQPRFPWVQGMFALAAVAVALLLVLYLPTGDAPKTARARAENRAAYRFLLPWLIGVAVFSLGPIFLSLLMSFASWDVIQPARWRGLENYREALFEDSQFWVSIKVTAIYTAAGVPLGVLGSLIIALLLNQKVRGVPAFRALYFLPTLASAVAAALVWRRIFSPDSGLLNEVVAGKVSHMLGLSDLLGGLSRRAGEPINWLGDERTALASLILMSLWGVGGGMVILLAGLQRIPGDYYEAAKLDGASASQRFFSVTLPHLSPSIFFCLITGVIGSFQAFTSAYVMTGGGPNNATMFFMLTIYHHAFEWLRMGYASALAWILFAIVLVFTLIQMSLGNRYVYYERDSTQ